MKFQTATGQSVGTLPAIAEVPVPEGFPVASPKPIAKTTEGFVDEAFQAQREIIACLGFEVFFAHGLKPECRDNFSVKRLTLLSLLSQIASKDKVLRPCCDISKAYGPGE